MQHSKLKIIKAIIVSPLVAPFVLAPLLFLDWAYINSDRLIDVTFMDLVDNFIIVALISIPVIYIIMFLIGIPLAIIIRMIGGKLSPVAYYSGSFFMGFILYVLFMVYVPSAVYSYYFALSFGITALGVSVLFNKIGCITNCLS